MTRVSIIGSCVTRDAFGPESADEWQVAAYYARTSMASAMADVAFDGVDVSGIESAFQRRMVQGDLSKTLPEFLATDDSDVIVYDPIDERFDLLRLPETGAICTFSAELARASSIPESERIVSGSPEFMRLWEQGWRRFLRLLDQRGRRSALRVNAARWAREVDDGGELPPSYPDETIEASNRMLDRLYLRMREDLAPHQFIEIDPGVVVAAREHKWGTSPFHYVPGFYEALREQLRSGVDASHRSGAARSWTFEAPRDRHTADVVGEVSEGEVVELELLLRGWEQLNYFAVGTVERGVYYRLIFSSVEQGESLRVSIPRRLLTDVSGNAGSVGPVERIRFYVSGTPCDDGAELRVATAGLRPAAEVPRISGTLHLAGWHPRYQLPIAEEVGVGEFSPARGLVAMYPVRVGSMRLWTIAGTRSGPRVAVGFHGAADRGTTEYPYFERVRSRKEAPWSFLLFSDATLAHDPDMALGWFLGKAEIDLMDAIEVLTRRFVRAVGGSSLAISGGSGGGFAALQLSARIDDSIALVFAPQTVLWRYHPDDWSRVSSAVFGAFDGVDDPSVQDRASVLPTYRRGTRNLVDFVINQGDAHHVVEHCTPFAEIFGLSAAGGSSPDGRINVIPVELGEGHLPVPKALFEDSLVRAFERAEARAS